MDLRKWIDNNKDIYIDLSNKIWEFAETGYQEFKSAGLLADYLEEEGFKVDYGVAEII